MMSEDLTLLSDAELARRKDEAWRMFQTVSRGNSNRAVETNWAAFVALRDEQADRERRKA